MMNRKVLFWPLAAMLLTACEKGLDEGIADVAPAGQSANSVLQVRTRSGGSAGGEATVAYPVTVYVFSGEECRAVQTMCDVYFIIFVFSYLVMLMPGGTTKKMPHGVSVGHKL